MRMLLALGIAVLLAAVALPQAASARRGPCIPGQKKPTCRIWTGKVKPVDDGDTINVDIAGDLTSRRLKVRLIGVQAMELRSYSRYHGRSGECHAVEAAERVEQLLAPAHGRVRVAAISAHSRSGGRGRLRRSIAVKRHGGWVDVGEVLLREGLALWFPNAVEWAWNGKYARLAEEAARRGVGIWNPE